MSQPGIFICPSCEAVVRSDQSLEEGVECDQCHHKFEKVAQRSTASAAASSTATLAAVVPKITTKSTSSGVVRNLTSQLATKEKLGITAAQPVSKGKIEAPESLVSSQPGDEEVVLPDGSRRIRRKKKRPRKESNKAIKLFLIGWVAVIAIAFSLYKIGQDEAATISEEENEELSTIVRDREFLKMNFGTVAAAFQGFMGTPSISEKGQFIDNSSQMARPFDRHYEVRRFPEPVGKIIPTENNVIALDDKTLAIESIWKDEEENKLEALHVWDGENWMLDWENFAPYSTQSWTRFSSRLGEDSGTFRLLVRRRRSLDGDENFSVNFYRPPEFGEKNEEFLRTASPAVELIKDSEVGEKFLKLWESFTEGKLPMNSMLGAKHDPDGMMRITVDLAWVEVTKIGLRNQTEKEMQMVVTDIHSGSWFGERALNFLRAAELKAMEEAQEEASAEEESAEDSQPAETEDPTDQ